MHLMDHFFTLLQTNVTLSADISCANFNVFNNPSVFYIRFNYVQKLSEDDQDRSKYVGDMRNCV